MKALTTKGQFTKTVKDELYDRLLPAMLALPEGWEKEVYCDEMGHITLSGPMARNTETRSPDLIGRIASYTISDLEELSAFKIHEVDDNHYAYDNEGEYHESADDGEGTYIEGEGWMVPLKGVEDRWGLRDEDWYQEMVDEMTENALKLYFK